MGVPEGEECQRDFWRRPLNADRERLIRIPDCACKSSEGARSDSMCSDWCQRRSEARVVMPSFLLFSWLGERLSERPAGSELRRKLRSFLCLAFRLATTR